MANYSKIITESLSDGPTFDMIHVGGGTYYMGGNDDLALEREKPVHSVKLSPFYIGKFLVTQDVWHSIMGNNPSNFQGFHQPVESVTWNDIQEFINRLNHIAPRKYRLPTEGEWEYAARGGHNMSQKQYLFAGSDRLKDVGWYSKNSNNVTMEVGLKYPNELGIYDMSGNVWEWCGDWYSDGFYADCRKAGIKLNPIGPKKGKSKVIRGGVGMFGSHSCLLHFEARAILNLAIAMLVFD